MRDALVHRVRQAVVGLGDEAHVTAVRAQDVERAVRRAAVDDDVLDARRAPARGRFAASRRCVASAFRQGVTMREADRHGAPLRSDRGARAQQGEVGLDHRADHVLERRPRRPAELLARLASGRRRAAPGRAGARTRGRRRRGRSGVQADGAKAVSTSSRDRAADAAGRRRSRRPRPAGASATSPRRRRRRSSSRASRRGRRARSSSCEPELDRRGRAGDLARHELGRAARRLVVVGDAARAACMP